LPPKDELDSDQRALRLLEEHHQFPGPFMFKVIGFARGDWKAEVQRAAEAVLGPLPGDAIVRARPSSRGKYLAVTLEVEVAGARQVLDIYRRLKELEGLVALV